MALVLHRRQHLGGWVERRRFVWVEPTDNPTFASRCNHALINQGLCVVCRCTRLPCFCLPDGGAPHCSLGSKCNTHDKTNFGTKTWFWWPRQNHPLCNSCWECDFHPRFLHAEYNGALNLPNVIILARHWSYWCWVPNREEALKVSIRFWCRSQLQAEVIVIQLKGLNFDFSSNSFLNLKQPSLSSLTSLSPKATNSSAKSNVSVCWACQVSNALRSLTDITSGM